MGCLLALLATLLAPVSPQPSNVLLVYVDNVGYGDLGCYGNASVQTPRIDRLAREGVRCTDFYVVASSCTPSRGALLTGRYPARNGLTHQLVPQENFRGIGLPQRERIIPQYLKPAGYATACFGKWNIGFAPGSRPTERGFDEFFGFRSGNINYYTHTYWGQPDMFRQTEPVNVAGLQHRPVCRGRRGFHPPKRRPALVRLSAVQRRPFRGQAQRRPGRETDLAGPGRVPEALRPPGQRARRERSATAPCSRRWTTPSAACSTRWTSCGCASGPWSR